MFYKAYSISITHKYHKGKAYITGTTRVKINRLKLACNCKPVVSNIEVHDALHIKEDKLDLLLNLSIFTGEKSNYRLNGILRCYLYRLQLRHC